LTTQQRIIAILGGARALGLKRGQTAPSLQEYVRAGFPFAALEALQQRYQITAAQMQTLLALSERTWARRKTEQRLSASESDRLYRVARIAALTEEVFGSTPMAAKWLQTPILALALATPLSLLDTDEGAQHVANILGRIEHGVFS
jgi:putative toxin-antitoxin system antitoxin component (TIGR02293 family)